MNPRNIPPIGTHGNAWNAASTGAGGVSNTLDTQNAPFVTAFGNVSGACTITVQVSQDGETFYDTQLAQVLAGAGNFCILGTIGARFIRLKSSADVTATATISAKD